MSTSTQPSTGTPVALTVSAQPPSPRPTPPSTLSPIEPIPPEKERELFNAFFDAETTLPDLARDLRTNVVSLAAWAAQPHIRERLLSIAELGRFRTQVVAAERTTRAIYALDTCSYMMLNDTGDPRTTSANARRRDVSRRSAIDTLRIGLRPLDHLYPPEEPDANTKGDTDGSSATGATKWPRELKHLPPLRTRTPSAIEHILSLSGTAPRSREAATDVSPGREPLVPGIRDPQAPKGRQNPAPVSSRAPSPHPSSHHPSSLLHSPPAPSAPEDAQPP